MKVLVIDDDADIRRIARISLAQVGGLQVALAASAEEGLVLARTDRPDVVLMDVMMPGLDGVSALARLRSDPETAGLPVVFLTARVQPTEVRHYLAQGAVGVLEKPFDPMTLAAELRRCLTEAGVRGTGPEVP